MTDLMNYLLKKNFEIRISKNPQNSCPQRFPPNESGIVLIHALSDFTSNANMSWTGDFALSRLEIAHIINKNKPSTQEIETILHN